MKNKIKVLLTAIFLITLCSCRQLIVKPTVWVMECAHGELAVTSEKGIYNFLITAKPDEGYCLEEKNLFVRGSDRNWLDTTISTFKLEDNVFGVKLYRQSYEKIVISGRFTEVEGE